MDITKNSAVLDMLEVPGFIAEYGHIIHTNAAAKRHLFEVGMPIADLLRTGKQEYETFQNGCLFLNVFHNGFSYEASVSRIDGQDIFLLETSPARSELRTLALAATQLRMPLADICAALDAFDQSSGNPEQMQQIRRNVHRLIRMIGNMSDASQNLCAKSELVTYDLTALFDEIIEKSAVLLEVGGTTIQYEAPKECIYAPADRGLLYRAIYNMISNCVKFSPNAQALTAKLVKLPNIVVFSVCGPSEISLPVDPFSRYLRAPGLEDSRNGIGLGMVMIRTAATAHGGTVLMEQLPDGQIRTSITLRLKNGNQNTVRNNTLRPDLYGGNSQALIELSDVLPNSVYDQ